MQLVDDLLDGRVRPGQRRSPFYALPFLRTNFFRVLAAAAVATLAAAWLHRRVGRPGDPGPIDNA